MKATRITNACLWVEREDRTCQMKEAYKGKKGHWTPDHVRAQSSTRSPSAEMTNHLDEKQILKLPRTTSEGHESTS